MDYNLLYSKYYYTMLKLKKVNVHIGLYNINIPS